MKLFFYFLTFFIFTGCSSQQTENEHGHIKNPQNENILHNNDFTPKRPIKTVDNQFTIETNKDGNDERINELNQNLTYYCMKGTRRLRFKSEIECQNFVKSTLLHCEKNHRIVNRALIDCVKSNLNIK